MAAEWIAIAVVIIIGFILLQLEHHARRYKIIIAIILIAILYFSIIGIFSSGEVDLTSPRGIVNSVYLYFGWIGSTVTSLWDIGTDTVTLVGNAVKINNTSEDPPKK